MRKKLSNEVQQEKTDDIIEIENATSFKHNLDLAKKIIAKHFPDQKGKLIKFKDIHNGYTNFSFLVTFENGDQYQVRLPHDGKIINRKNEYDILFKLLKTNDYIYFDPKTGIAIKKWIVGKTPSRRIVKTTHFQELIFNQIKKLHKIQLPKNHKIDVLKFDTYNQNLYRLKFIYKKKFLCLIDRRRRDPIVLNHTDINPQNIIYNKHKKIASIIDYEWSELTSDYYDYANFVRETGINYKNIDWSKYIENFDMQIFEHYLFMISMYSFLWTYAMPQTVKIIKYRRKVYKQIKKYYPAVINVDKSCYIEHDKDEKK